MGEERANKTLDLDAPFLYDMNKSLSVQDISNDPLDDFYVTDANKPYTGIRATD